MPAVAQAHNRIVEEIRTAKHVEFVRQLAHFWLCNLQRREMLRRRATYSGERRAKHICLVAGAIEIADVDQAGQQRMTGRTAELERAYEICQRERLSGMIGNEIDDGRDALDAR